MLNTLLRITRSLPLRGGILLPVLVLLSLIMMLPGYSAGAERPHGLPPADDATYIPQLGGLLNKTLRNHYGQEKELAEMYCPQRQQGEGGQGVGSGRRPLLCLFHIAGRQAPEERSFPDSRRDVLSPVSENGPGDEAECLVEEEG